ncbi:murein biosynthesis integral membrane protein MurJ [Ignatzschineria ureiclastica]|uniref:Probable lipid II flippase MurJ n=1 Tax=Ignatzschineria ureiclastica TaxID=472582 RepID=A0A2U2AD81_9GAMM|nr:murein biosynthesis integral membrane protein MurJ [Ignatzschineria ureiclastica]PWD80577.1 murein biosynthesis integral membrane protein MurJ [Ignatzschineria ureiclastica]GHA02457.1 putative lipid II flippase MurJ [Ignatzschineria ureiclastica]
MKSSLFRSLFTVSGFTFLSRVMGLLRDIVFASFFGATAAMDAFSVAFRIPNLFRRFFGEGAFNQAFVPVFSEYRLERSFDELRRFLAEVSGTLGVILLAITALGLFFSSEMVLLFASGFRDNPEKFYLTESLLHLMLPYLFFICMTAMYSSVLNALHQFAIPAATPILLNLFLIAGAMISSLWAEPIMALGYAVFIAGIVQLLTLLFAVKKAGLLSQPTIRFSSPGVKKVMWLMVPALIGSSSSQINILINTQLASRLETGSITWLYYSDRLVEFAIGTFAVALGTVILPKLSELHTQKDWVNLGKTIDWGVELSLIIGIPAMLGLVFLAEPLLAILFMRGEFTATDVVMAGRSLMTYALSIPAFFIIRILAPVYFSRQNTKTPMYFSLIAIGTNILLQLILVRYYQHAGLALSSSIAAWVNALLLAGGLIVMKVHYFKDLLTRKMLALLPANGLLIVALIGVNHYQSFWFTASIWLKLPLMIGVILLIIILYFAVLHFAGFKLARLKGPLGNIQSVQE